MSDPYARESKPVTLAEQMFAWGAWWDGQPMSEIAMLLRRRIPQVRAMMFGKP